MSTPEDQIVFEDLHGMNEKEPVTVDLDADTKDAGIQLAPDDQSAGTDTGDDDTQQLDGLRSADLDDADTPPTKKPDASSDSAEDGYSKKVKARIQRATRGEKAAKQEASYWKGQAEKLSQDSHARDKQAFERTIEQAGSAITQVQTDLEVAIEAGNTKDQVRLTSRLTDLKADKVMAEANLDNLPSDGNVQPFDGKISSEGKKDTETEASKWTDDRADWYRQPGFERQTRLANRLDREVFADGYDPGTPEYFEELDKRIKAKQPELYDDADSGAEDTDTDTGKQRGKNVVAPVSGNETRHQNTSSSKVELDAEDFATMRQFNLDPNDPEVLKEFARNKREAEQGAN